ncbi:hypothetical protein C8R44DRAFT_868992 [Mycena epipterygia]|nr:hypothetical protein C8R44DRAFT_868992 [Mycena epipterygia]
MSSSSQFRCAVPFYHDPGQPDGPVVGQKIYLVSGVNVEYPGAYVSWPSAAAEYNTSSSASVKKYKNWARLEAAWFAGCDRGEHNHPAAANEARQRRMDGTLVVHSAATSATLVTSPLVCSPPRSSASHQRWRLETASASPLSSSQMPSLADAHVRSRSPSTDAPAIPGKMVYAVKHNGQGVVFDDYHIARKLYHKIQAEGGSPALASSPSLTEGVCFVEGFCTDNGSREGLQRQEWIEEERAAHTQRVVNTWENAVDSWRMGSDGVWTSESDSSSDKSSVSTEIEELS